MTRCYKVLALGLTLAGCSTFGAPVIADNIPHCEKLVPPSLLAAVEGVDIPVAELHEDGHEKAEPWQLGYIGQTGQLDKANENAPAVDHIYRHCLELQREAVRRTNRGFFARLFGR